MKQCAKAPDGKHCPHEYPGVWMATTPAPLTCCHCGKNMRTAGHGPHLPVKGYTGSIDLATPVSITVKDGFVVGYKY